MPVYVFPMMQRVLGELAIINHGPAEIGDGLSPASQNIFA